MFKEKFQISPHFFEDFKDEVNKENQAQVNRITILGCIISAALLGMSLLIEDLRAAWLPYLCMLVFFLIISLLKDKISNSLVTFYIMMTGCFAFGVVASFFCRTAQSNTTFCVFLVVLPLFLMDKQWRVHGYLTIILIVYLVFAICCRDNESFFVYVVDSISYYVLGVAVYYHNISMKARNLIHDTDLKKKVEMDSLTAIYNRSALEEHINNYISNHEEHAAFILIDVDNFKSINDNFGHTTGDNLLHQTANILKKQFRKSDYIGRLGGDEFVVFMPKIINDELIVNRMEALVKKMDRTLIVDDETYNISGSIGISFYPKDGRTFEELYKKADEAMYESKKSGKNQYTIYTR